MVAAVRGITKSLREQSKSLSIEVISANKKQSPLKVKVNKRTRVEGERRRILLDWNWKLGIDHKYILFFWPEEKGAVGVVERVRRSGGWGLCLFCQCRHHGIICLVLSPRLGFDDSTRLCWFFVYFHPTRLDLSSILSFFNSCASITFTHWCASRLKNPANSR